MRHRFTKVLLGAALFMLLGGTATVAARSHGSSHATASYNVGFIYPRTGPLGTYGAEEIQGFKEGLKYLTKGTNKVNGKTLNITYVDDKNDAATAVSAAKDQIGQGTKILMGTGSSGIALQLAPLAAQNQVLYSRARLRSTGSPASTSTRSGPGARPSRTSTPPPAT